MKNMLFYLMVISGLILSACQPIPSKTSAPSNNPGTSVVKTALPSQANASPTPTVKSTQTNADTLDLLTGLNVDNPAILNRRPVMIKVSNYPRSGRPHAGLAFADIVFDYFIGSGDNRFLAIFYGQDAPTIGPVRSGRLVDIQLTNLYQGILGFGSADGDTLKAIYDDLGRRAISNPEAPCPVFCGADTHSVTGVFADSAALIQWYSQKVSDNRRYDLSGMVFNPEALKGGKLADQVTILYNYYDIGNWRYDASTGKYLRWTENTDAETDLKLVPSVERITGQQLAFANVIILFGKYIEFAPSKFDVELSANTSGERAVFFRDGQMFEGQWKSVSHSKPLQFFDQNGNPMPLKPGNSWIVLADNHSTFKEKQPAQWEMFFMMS
jgi:hypothetical protein